ncbi:GbsR/MarR family transcriptional regulator [Candidatus Moduliflexota bacterium]
MNDAAVDDFLDVWGEMGASWGISRSVARVHGLLIVTTRHWTLDEISERLQISRSNVSTSLKELRSWRVIRKTRQAGDRKEYYTCEPDVWQMLFSILRERKRREFDPVVQGVGAAAAAAGKSGGQLAGDRLRQMEHMLSTFDRLGERVLSSGERARALISFLEGKV